MRGSVARIVLNLLPPHDVSTEAAQNQPRRAAMVYDLGPKPRVLSLKSDDYSIPFFQVWLGRDLPTQGLRVFLRLGWESAHGTYLVIAY